MPALAGAAQPGVEEARRVGQQIKRRSRPVQALDQGRHLGEGMLQHLVETTVEGLDQGLLAGMLGLEPSCRLGGIAARVLQLVPLAWWSRWPGSAPSPADRRSACGRDAAGSSRAARRPCRRPRPRGRSGLIFGAVLGVNFGAFSRGVFSVNLVSKINKLKSGLASVFCWSWRAVLLGCDFVPPGPLAGP